MFHYAEKCPANSFQSKGICQPCPLGTFQDRAGQTECKPCSNRPSVTPSGYYNSRCLQRTSRPVHSSIVALAKLPNRKSSWTLASPSAIKTRQLNGKLGNVAAAHTTTTAVAYKQVTDTVAKYNKKKAMQFQESSSKNRRHHPHSYQLTTGRAAVAKNPSVTNDTTIDEDPCVPNPCLAGGTCFRSVRYTENKIVSTFKCSCRLGTKGRLLHSSNLKNNFFKIMFLRYSLRDATLPAFVLSQWWYVSCEPSGQEPFRTWPVELHLSTRLRWSAMRAQTSKSVEWRQDPPPPQQSLQHRFNRRMSEPKW